MRILKNKTMKRILQINIIIAVLGLISIPAFGQAGTINYSQYCYNTSFHSEWIIDVKEFKAVRFTYTTDVVYGPPMISIYELGTDGVTYNNISSISGYTSGTICTNSKTGKAKVVFNAWAIGNATFNIQYTADNSIITKSDLSVGGNGVINGNLTVNTKLSIPSTTVSNSIMGKLGIGTTDPSSKVEIRSDHAYSEQLTNLLTLNNAPTGNNENIGALLFKQTDTGNGITWNTAQITSKAIWDGTNFSGTLDFRVKAKNTSQTIFPDVKMTILENGNVGIGTSTPNAKLEVHGKTMIGQYTDGTAAIDAYNSYAYFGCNTPTNGIAISSGGNVQIGVGITPNPLYKLEVNGIIHAKEVKIDIDGLADFVFHPSYSLMPLHEVEQYVKTNNHLPEIPSAAEVSKNGMSIGEMQNKLLQKIEELTLYVIEQDKKIERLEKNAK